VLLFCAGYLALPFLLVLFISVQESNEWESGLFDIFADGCGTCCLSFCLPCYQHGKNFETYSRQTGKYKKSVCFEKALNCACMYSIAEFFTYFVGGFFGQIALAGRDTLDPGNFAFIMSTALCIHSLNICVPVVSSAAVFEVPLRRSVRKMHGIPEENSCCGSDCASAICFPCSSIQLAHHMKKHPLPAKLDK
jgi:Cys-rich protein (TIGR01571 family)